MTSWLSLPPTIRIFFSFFDSDGFFGPLCGLAACFRFFVEQFGHTNRHASTPNPQRLWLPLYFDTRFLIDSCHSRPQPTHTFADGE